jgi:type III pantothenate kinase
VVAAQHVLTIDCGNSTIRCRRADAAIWTTSSQQPDLDGLVPFVGPDCSRVVAVSVVPAALALVQGALARRNPPLKVEVAGQELSCPLVLAYDTIATLGADRWLGAFAAHQRFGTAITVDCGSATTVNLVTDDGVFHGGAIAPGLGALVVGMATVTGALPRANLDAEPAMPARSTQSCVDAGVLLGWLGLVERLVSEVRRGHPSAALVVTGGHAERLRKLLAVASFAPPCEFVPELLHDGLVALASSQPMPHRERG